MKLRTLIIRSTLVLSTAFSSISMAEEETIKVGVLHSLTGTMAISETTLKDTVLMMVEEQNKKGGLLGKKLEAVVVDPASNWPLFAEKARELLVKEKVDVMLKDMMAGVYKQMKDGAGEDGSLEEGCNRAGFLKVARALKELGWVY